MRLSLLTVSTLAVLSLAACGYSDPYANTGAVADESPGPSASPSGSPGADDFYAGAGLPVITYPDGLKVIDLKVGTGPVAANHSQVSVQYTGWLSNGTVFDTSRQPSRTPYSLQIGAKKVIPGWEEGIQGMKVGGKRKLIIPPALAYGSAGQTNPNTGATVIPPNATLTFEIELVLVSSSPASSPSPSASPTH